MTNFEVMIKDFMLYCSSRNLSKKTLGSYEQTLKLFTDYPIEGINVDVNSGGVAGQTVISLKACLSGFLKHKKY